MTDKELRKKLRKKAKKLAKWGKRHGIQYISMCALLDGYDGQDGDYYGGQFERDTDTGIIAIGGGFLGDDAE